MQKQQETQQKFTGITSTQNNQQEDSKQESNFQIEVEQIEKTPFQLVKKEEGWFVGWIGYQLSPFFKKKTTAKNYHKTHHWELTGIYVLALLERERNEKKE